jgi:cyanophycinase
MTFTRAILFLAMAALGGLAFRTAPAGSPYQYFRVGNAADAHPSGVKPGFALLGGGKDLDEAFRWLCERSHGGDFLILRATGTDAYNPYVSGLCRENSVATLIIPNRQAASDPFVAQTIRNAEAIFIAGGDQANYVNFWTDTPVQESLNDAIQRGVPMGGTSAGLAVLGEFVYSAQGDKPDGPDLQSKAALENPFDPQVRIVHDFLRIPALRGVIADTHFTARDRLGRLLVFMARILASGDARAIHGLGIDQQTALLLNPDGKGIVAGLSAVHLLSSSVKPIVCIPGQPLSFAPVLAIDIAAGGKVDFKHWTATGTPYLLTVDAGKINSTKPGFIIINEFAELFLPRFPVGW